MHGYDVITSDGEKMGQVVGTDGGMLVIERGTIRKSRYAVPQEVVETDAAESAVKLSVSKRVVEEGPSVGDEIDEREVAAYYGLARGEDRPETLGYGEVTADDPSRGAEQDAHRAGIETADERRARIRETMRPEAEHGAPKGARGIHQDYWNVKE